MDFIKKKLSSVKGSVNLAESGWLLIKIIIGAIMVGAFYMILKWLNSVI